jgi:hypothetical protein
MWEPRRLSTVWAFTACYTDTLPKSAAILPVTAVAIVLIGNICMYFARFAVGNTKLKKKIASYAYTRIFDVSRSLRTVASNWPPAFPTWRPKGFRCMIYIRRSVGREKHRSQYTLRERVCVYLMWFINCLGREKGFVFEQNALECCFYSIGLNVLEHFVCCKSEKYAHAFALTSETQTERSAYRQKQRIDFQQSCNCLPI